MTSVFRKISYVFIAILLAVLLTSCGEDNVPAPVETAPEETAEPEPEEVREPREKPECLLSTLNEETAEAMDTGLIDFGSAESGYVAVSITDEARLKFQIVRGEETYTYDLPGDGSVTAFPLNMGSGEYEFRLMRNIEESKYSKAWTDTREIEISDEFQPYLRPSIIADYDDKSKCVELAYDVTKLCENDVEIAAGVYEYIANNIEYDHDKAETVESGYLPHPDETLASKTGICFDYAALAAAMLRSQGIPCQVITGWVGEEEQYHAWNRIYLTNSGWITVEISAAANRWKRVDITYAASNVETEFIDDDGQYTTRFTY